MSSSTATELCPTPNRPLADRQAAADLLARLLTEAQQPLDTLADDWRKIMLLTIRTERVEPEEAIAQLLRTAATTRELCSSIMTIVSTLSQIASDDVCWQSERAQMG